MNTLERILSSRVRAKLFQSLFGLGKMEIHIRELARQSGFAEASLRQELRNLKTMELVASRRDGNRVYYRANDEHPLYPIIYQLVIRTVGLVEVLRMALEETNISLAFVFGSIASQQEIAHSDVDLMVFGNTGLRKLTSRLKEATDAIGREINPHVMTPAEYRERMSASDHFVNRVLAGPKIFVIGNEDDFEAMGK